ncbi:MAG TPA: hypothetical protein PLT47_11865 [Bacteroidales bacterium]|nr:hypothetical protein [Bacteroidales bacterium]HQI71442.1 hypothetical protein [Bacteroidales bacterium]
MKKFLLMFGSGLLLMALLSSCKKDPPPDDTNIDISTSHGIFIVNEGNFQWSNASVTYYNFSNQDYSEDIFLGINNRPLGDVAQSICVYNGKAYIVVNNSNKIEVVNVSDFVSCGVISGLSSPRYIVPVSTEKAYVSDLYSNNISIVDLNTNTITGSIPCHGSTEEMLFHEGQLIVTNTRTDKIYFINTITDAVTDSLQLGFASNSLVLDKNDKLWVMCAGDGTHNVNASLHRVDIGQMSVEQSFQLSSTLDIWDKIAINATRDTIYYMCHGVYRLPISADALPGEVFIPQGNSIFYGLAVNPFSNTIIVADAVDYVQKGKVYYYSAAGTLQGTINAGVLPSDFYFF